MPMNAYQSAVPSDLSGSLVPFRFGTLAACHSAPLRKACSFIAIPSRGMIPYSGRERRYEKVPCFELSIGRLDCHPELDSIIGSVDQILLVPRYLSVVWTDWWPKSS